MSWISDATLDHLREMAATPDMGETKYQLIREIGRGGMGVVWLAEDRELRREVAVKILAPEIRSEDSARRMLREARVLARLEHPGIVPVHDVGRLSDGRVFCVMKLVRGTRLDQIAGITELTDLLRIHLRICEAVGFANAHGVVHRDLKPHNVMIGEFGEVLVMDWGVARVIAHDEQDAPSPSSGGRRPNDDLAETADGTVVGTPGFMAPEQLRGDLESVDERTDVFALGAILAFLATAHRGDRRVPPPLDAIREKAMAVEREERYESAGALAADIARFVDGLPVEAYREPWWERIARWLRPHRTAVTLVVAYLVMRVVLFLLFRR